MNEQTDSPQVSVVMAARNAALTLRSAVESVLAQSFGDFELIVVEDGSSDETWAILEEYARADRRVRPVRNDTNLRLPRSLNRGARLARGKYIARHDADDVSLPDRLALQVRYAEAHPDVGVLGTQMETVDEAGVTTGEYRLPTCHSLILWQLFLGRSFAHPTVLMRRDVFAGSGGYAPACLHAEDIDLWTRLAGSTRFANLPDICYRYRVLSQSVSRRHRAEQLDQVLRIRTRFATRVLGRRVPTRAMRGLRDFCGGYHLLSEGERTAAAALLRALFDALSARGDFLVEEIPQVREDLERRIEALSRPPDVGAMEVGKEERLRVAMPRPVYLALMAIRHPAEAAARLKRLLRR